MVDLWFGNPFITPTFDEHAMFLAFSAALRSADLSRQVGAVITKDSQILSAGANDCPKAGGDSIGRSVTPTRALSRIFLKVETTNARTGTRIEPSRFGLSTRSCRKGKRRSMGSMRPSCGNCSTRADS